MRRPKLRITGIEEGEEYQLRGKGNIFNKIVEENLPTNKNEMTMSIKEAYRTPKSGPEKKFLPTNNSQNAKCSKQRKNTKSSKGKRSCNI